MPRILGLDYGERRIGVAVSDEAGIIAMPLCKIQVQNRRQALAEIRRISLEKDVARIVVGMPLNMNGTRGPQAESVDVFVKQIGEHVNIPVEVWDERLSSQMAERVLIDFDTSRSKRKGVIDKLAAQVVLQGYLDAREISRGQNSEHS